MEWINGLPGKTVGLDTAPLIYFIEENPIYLEAATLFFKAIDKGDFIGSTCATATQQQHGTCVRVPGHFAQLKTDDRGSVKRDC